MTQEEAIKYLRQIYPNGGHCWLDSQRIDAIEMAITALSQPFLPSNINEAAKKIAYDVCKQLPNGTEKDSIVYYAILAAKAGAEWMAGQGVKIGETKIYLEDDGDEPPYSQEWLDLESTEFKLPNGAFQPGDEVEVILRKKQ